MSKKRGAGGAEAERIVEAWLELDGWTVHRAAAAGVGKTGDGGWFVKSHDLFGCLDMIAFKRSTVSNVETRAVQVTTQSGRTARRRKLEAHHWPFAWSVLLISHETSEDPTNRRRKIHFLKIEEMDHDENWMTPTGVAIDMAAAEAHRSAKAKAKKAARAERAAKKPKRKKQPDPSLAFLEGQKPALCAHDISIHSPCEACGRTCEVF